MYYLLVFPFPEVVNLLNLFHLIKHGIGKTTPKSRGVIGFKSKVPISCLHK